jgi:WhiB family redox-sensing transcriptional regulator
VTLAAPPAETAAAPLPPSRANGKTKPATSGSIERPTEGAPSIGELLGDVGDPPEWQDRALCAQTDPEAFFPEKGGSTREAKRICLGCEVKAECLEYALANDERFGIWGGMSERERRRLRRPAR